VYAGVLKLSKDAALTFADTLDRQIRGGLHDPKAYYFHVVRALIENSGIEIGALDIAGNDWLEIDRPDDVVAAKARFERIHTAEPLSSTSADSIRHSERSTNGIGASRETIERAAAVACAVTRAEPI